MLRYRPSRMSLAPMLLLATAAFGEVTVVERADRSLAMDALTWARCRWQQSSYMGMVDSRYDFFRPYVFLGFAGRIGETAALRLFGDIAALPVNPVQDAYVDLHWPSGIGVRVGQFIPPLGFEALEPLEGLKIPVFSFLARYWKPWNPRDVGVMLEYAHRRFKFAAAIVNGNGINQGYEDNNKWKDVCGRVVFVPMPKSGLEVALRGYSGWIDEAGARFGNVAGECRFDRKPLSVVGECQYARQGTLSRTSFYVKAARRLHPMLEPVLRFQMEFRSEDRYDTGLTSGVNFLALNDKVTIMLHYDYRRVQSQRYELRVSEQKLSLQLQAVL